MSLVHEFHPNLGEYLFSPPNNVWTCRQKISEGLSIVLSGQGPKPNEQQLQLWRAIESRFSELNSSAYAAFPQAPNRLAVEISHCQIREVRLESGQSFTFLFDTPISDENDMWPMIVFHDWKVVSSDWVP